MIYIICCIYIYVFTRVALANKESDELGRRSLWASELLARVPLLARAFYSLGLRRGDYMSIYLPNTTEFHPCVLGAWSCGATISPADPFLTEKGLVSQLKEVRPKVVLCCRENLETVRCLERRREKTFFRNIFFHWADLL